MPEQSWEEFLAEHAELADTYVLKYVAERGDKWIAVSEGVMYAEAMSDDVVLFGWAVQKQVIEHAAMLWHDYTEHEDANAAAELDYLLEGILMVLAGGALPEVKHEPAPTRPRWVTPDEVEDDDDDEG